jgi:hypothetical protein
MLALTHCGQTRLTATQTTTTLQHHTTPSNYKHAGVKTDSTAGELNFQIGPLSQCINIPTRNAIIVQALTHDPPQAGETIGRRREQSELPRALVFCAGVQHAQDLAKLLNMKGELCTHSIA